ncbi:MAG: tRNA (N6-isopentenyl adenosine(37)-C2)-methylthiotransferase MiaB [Pseudomonadota bacterium]
MKQHYLYIKTIGCQMNHYDSERMARILAPLNYIPTEDIEQADLILLNTCAIRAKAEQKVFSFLGRLRRMKQENPNLIIGVAGCVAQQEGKRILKRMPHVDMVFGTHALFRLPGLISKVKIQRERVCDTTFSDTLDEPDLAGVGTRRTTAFVTIMRGCDNFCTYCVVPYVRGREMSRPHNTIIREIRSLVRNGVREVTLLGQNVNSYGQKEGISCNFPELLRKVNNIDGLERIRFTTSHPKDLSDDLIEAIASLPNICPHIHLPVQSGSDRILKRMNRVYTVKNYMGKVSKLKITVPHIAITSDIIVGFPGETEEDFEATLALVQEMDYENIFSFKYSDRPNAPSAKFRKKVPEEIKQKRLEHLQRLQERITHKKNKALVGTTQEVLVEGFSKNTNSRLTGRTLCNKIVNIDAMNSLVGQVVSVKVEKAYKHCLMGSVGKIDQVNTIKN